MFSTLHDTYFSLSMYCYMSSGICFNLDKSKVFSSGKELSLWDSAPNDSNKEVFWTKHWENDGNQHCLLFFQWLSLTSFISCITFKLNNIISFSCTVFNGHQTSYHTILIFNDPEEECLLTHSHTMTPFDAPGKQAFWKHRGKMRNCF